MDGRFQAEFFKKNRMEKQQTNKFGGLIKKPWVNSLFLFTLLLVIRLIKVIHHKPASFPKKKKKKKSPRDPDMRIFRNRIYNYTVPYILRIRSMIRSYAIKFIMLIKPARARRRRAFDSGGPCYPDHDELAYLHIWGTDTTGCPGHAVGHVSVCRGKRTINN